MLPLGDKFVLLALLCIGKCVLIVLAIYLCSCGSFFVTGVESGIIGAQPNTFNAFHPDYISEANVSLSREVREAFSELKHKPVGVDEDLIDLVHSLFMGAEDAFTAGANRSKSIGKENGKKLLGGKAEESGGLVLSDHSSDEEIEAKPKKKQGGRNQGSTGRSGGNEKRAAKKGGVKY